MKKSWFQNLNFPKVDQFSDFTICGSKNELKLFKTPRKRTQLNEYMHLNIEFFIWLAPDTRWCQFSSPKISIWSLCACLRLPSLSKHLQNRNVPMFHRGYLRAPWTDFDLTWFKMTAQTSYFQRYQNYQKRTSRKEVTHQTMKSIFPNNSWCYNVLMPTKSDLDGPGEIEIFQNRC